MAASIARLTAGGPAVQSRGRCSDGRQNCRLNGFNRRMRFVNARFIDLATGTVNDPIDFSVAGGRLMRSVPEGPEEIIDLGGRFVIPGLWDAHVHFTSWAVHRHRLDLSEATDQESVLHLLQEFASAHPEADPVHAVGLRDAEWASAPDTAALDAAFPTRAVVIEMFDMHQMWLNSVALRRYGFPSVTDGGPGSGLLFEEQVAAVHQRLPQDDQRIVDRWVAEQQQAAAAKGVVGIVDFEEDWPIPRWRDRMDAGIDRLRVVAATWPEDLSAAITSGVRTGVTLDTSGLLIGGPLKVICDGSLSSRTAWCRQPYADPRADVPFGVADRTAEELADLMSRADQAGIDSAVHAIGDAAAGMVLDCFAETGAHGRIEHAELLTTGDIERMSALRVTAGVQPAHLLVDRELIDRQWAGRADRCFALRELLDAAVAVEFGSDAPVTPLDPWLAIRTAVLRAEPGQDSWHPEQAITLQEALCASTHGVRTLVPGAVADVAVLDDNPFQLGAARLDELRVSLTMVDGRITYGL